MKKIFTSLLVATMLFTGCSKPVELNLKENLDLTIELGDTISLDPELYLEGEFEEDVLQNIDIECTETFEDNNEPEIDKKNNTMRFIKAGDYDFVIKYDDLETPFVLKVKDTTAPEFTKFEESISLSEGESFNIDDYFTAEDLSEVEIKTEGDYDVNKAGTYNIKVIAKDESGNESTKDLSIVINAPEPEPQTTPQPEPQSSTGVYNPPVGRTVYIAASGNGTKYHSNPNCSRMNGVIQMTEDQAVASGYTPCKKCY